MQATRTYLELTDPTQVRPAFGDFPGLVVTHVEHPAPTLYRDCYRTVGEAYHWRDRWNWSDVEIAAHLSRPEITAAGLLWRWPVIRHGSSQRCRRSSGRCLSRSSQCAAPSGWWR